MAAFYTFLFFILTATLYVAVKGDCGQQPDIAHGYPDRVDLSYGVGSTVSYTCETGYEFRAQNSTEMTITCEEGDTWSPVTNCQVKSCPHLPSDAVLSSVNTSYGAEVQISCAHSNERIPGVAVGDSLFTVCQENKTWSYWDQTQEEACVEIACEYPMENSFGDALTATSGSPGDLAQFTCFDKYFYRDGSNQKWFMCNAAGLWDANFQSGGPTTAEKCNPKVCPSLIETYFLEHIIVEPAIQFADQEVALICEPGYEFNDTSTEQSSFCFGGNLTWSFIPFNCQEKVCEPVLYLEYGNASTSDNWYGSEVNYTCNTGYWFPNGDTARVSVCNEHGKWSEVIPQCTDEKIEIDSGFSNTVTNADLGERFIYIAIGIISTVLVMVIVFDILTFPRQISFLKMNLRSRFSRFRESEELDVKSVDGEALMRSSMISLASGRGKITPAPQRIDQVDTTQEKQASSILISQDSRV